MFCCNFAQEVPYKALIVVPVADLVCEPLSLKYGDIEEAYKTIPISWGPIYADKSICPRQHQALFNEQVTVVATQKDEVCIEITNAFSQINAVTEPQAARYWTLQKNIFPLDALPQDIQCCFPQPVNYCTKNMHEINNNVITLAWPFYDATTKLRYSVGTRFVYIDQTDDAYITYIYNPLLHALHKVMIPKRYALVGSHNQPEICISNFVKLLRDWARSAGFIPFVWGGVSFSKRVTMEGFELKYAQDAYGDQRAYWQLCEDDGPIYTGFDASGLILRAAQICGIPYFFKNSAMVQEYASSSCEQLQEGDLIIIPNGLLVVSDITNNKVIGAFGYQFGFGKVVERTLADVFEGINNYADLLYACQNQYSLKLKDKKGNIIGSTKNYWFLKLASLWQN